MFHLVWFADVKSQLSPMALQPRTLGLFTKYYNYNNLPMSTNYSDCKPINLQNTYTLQVTSGQILLGAYRLYVILW